MDGQAEEEEQQQRVGYTINTLPLAFGCPSSTIECGSNCVTARKRRAGKQRGGRHIDCDPGWSECVERATSTSSPLTPQAAISHPRMSAIIQVAVQRRNRRKSCKEKELERGREEERACLKMHLLI